jgi:hypothetical protein
VIIKLQQACCSKLVARLHSTILYQTCCSKAACIQQSCTKPVVASCNSIIKLILAIFIGVFCRYLLVIIAGTYLIVELARPIYFSDTLCHACFFLQNYSLLIFNWLEKYINAVINVQWFSQLKSCVENKKLCYKKL